MKTTLKTLIILLAFMLISFFIQSCSAKPKIEKPISLENVPVYTIQGFKDKRIDAMYSVVYVSSNLDKKECHQKNIVSSSKKPVIGNRIYHVLDENYYLEIPIELTDNTDLCGFKFRQIELIMKRHGESGYDISSLIPILDSKQEVDWRRQTSGSDKIIAFKTDKKYFRVAPETSFLCRTRWYEITNRSKFYCIMQIDSGDITLYPKGTAKNPQFGVDKIIDSTLTINIVVDNNGSDFSGESLDSGFTQDYFREYIPPKSLFKRMFD